MGRNGLLRATFAFLMALAPAFATRAVDKTWLGADGGLWSTGFYWDNTTVPSYNDDVYVGNHSPAPGTLNLNLNYNYSYNYGYGLYSLTVDSSALGGYM